MTLSKKHCKPCEGKAKPLDPFESKKLNEEVHNWLLEDDKRIEKIFVFKSFQEALKFINQVAEIAEAEDHHPDICLFSYKKVRIELSTHAIDGLSENDFILASKIDELRR